MRMNSAYEVVPIGFGLSASFCFPDGFVSDAQLSAGCWIFFHFFDGSDPLDSFGCIHMLTPFQTSCSCPFLMI